MFCWTQPRLADIHLDASSFTVFSLLFATTTTVNTAQASPSSSCTDVKVWDKWPVNRKAGQSKTINCKYCATLNNCWKGHSFGWEQRRECSWLIHEYFLSSFSAHTFELLIHGSVDSAVETAGWGCVSCRRWQIWCGVNRGTVLWA